MSVMEQPVEKSGAYYRLAEKLMPVFQRSIARDDDRSLFIPFADDFIENIQKVIGERLKSPVIQDEEVRFQKLLDLFVKAVVCLSGVDILEHFHRANKRRGISFTACLMGDGFREKCFADAGWTDEENVVMCLEKTAGMKIHDLSTVNPGIEIEVKLNDTLVSAQVRLFDGILLFLLFPAIDFILGKDEEEIGVAHLCLHRLFNSHVEVFRE